ncbi:MAG TPA: hypothetical protein VJA21_16795 [Verrucomicrobiae bacterium]
MSSLAHLIEIDRVILSRTAAYPGDRLRLLVQEEILRVLSEDSIPAEATAPNVKTTVAGEVAHSVLQAARRAEG